MKLNPCRFCHSTDILTTPENGDQCAKIVCGNCLAEGPLKYSLLESVDAWNASDWRQIAEAPKDGTRVLLFGIEGYDVVIGFWNSYHVPHHWCYSGETVHSEGNEPTHFQPLPEPPKL